jgi:amino acid permease
MDDKITDFSNYMWLALPILVFSLVFVAYMMWVRYKHKKRMDKINFNGDRLLVQSLMFG